LRVNVTYGDPGNPSNTESATSNTSGAVADSADLTATLSSTTAAQGTPITVTAVLDATSNVTASATYAWETSTNNFSTFAVVGTSSSYAPTSTDVGKMLRLVTTYAGDPSGSESTTNNLGTVAATDLAPVIDLAGNNNG